MHRVIIVHGYGGHPNIHWLPWLRMQLELQGVATTVPRMPSPDTPKLTAWLEKLHETVGESDEQTYLVGHSLGCPAILRYLEQLSGKQIGGALLVAGFAAPIGMPEINNFTEGTWDESAVRSAAKKIVLINSDDDPYVPLTMGEDMKTRFDAELIVLHGAGHINADAGYSEAPIVLEQLNLLMSGSH